MLIIRALMALSLSAAAADAAVLINRADVGTAISVDYAGTVLGIPTSGLGAIGSFVYTGASADGRTYNFSYALTNDSTLSSRIRSFGFDVLGSSSLAGLSSTGTYSAPAQNPLSGLIGTDLCFSVASLGTCTTGSGGLTAGQSAAGSFALTFANVMASVELSDFTVNYQGVGGLFAGTGRGDGVATVPTPPAPTDVVIAAPEIGTWAMMIGGFGLIGWVMRRRGRNRIAAFRR